MRLQHVLQIAAAELLIVTGVAMAKPDAMNSRDVYDVAPYRVQSSGPIYMPVSDSGSDDDMDASRDDEKVPDSSEVEGASDSDSDSEMSPLESLKSALEGAVDDLPDPDGSFEVKPEEDDKSQSDADDSQAAQIPEDEEMLAPEAAPGEDDIQILNGPAGLITGGSPLRLKGVTPEENEYLELAMSQESNVAAPMDSGAAF